MPKIVDVLNVLSYHTPEEIRDALVQKGIKGYRGHQDYCALACYITGVVGRQVKVSIFRVRDASEFRYHDGVPLPDSVKEFVQNFDAGKYPELVDTQGPYDLSRKDHDA